MEHPHQPQMRTMVLEYKNQHLPLSKITQWNVVFYIPAPWLAYYGDVHSDVDQKTSDNRKDLKIPMQFCHTAILCIWTDRSKTNHVWLIRDRKLAGWWLIPTPLKNDGVRQLGWWNSQYMENYQRVFPINTSILVGEFPMNHHESPLWNSQLNGKS